MVDPFALDVESLTLAEFAVFEAVAGMDMREVLEAVEDRSGVLSPSFMIALVTVANNRQDESFTVNDASGLTLADLETTGG